MKRGYEEEKNGYDDVASLVEAWIETEIIYNEEYKCYVASLVEAWIETRQLWLSFPPLIRRLPRGGVD